ncbi:hypothetical protein BH18ACI4_BH18ACI4_17660 [soil metagenome]
MSSEASRPVGNWLLDALSSDGYERLVEHLEPVPFSLGEVIYESGVEMKFDHRLFAQSLLV